MHIQDAPPPPRNSALRMHVYLLDDLFSHFIRFPRHSSAVETAEPCVMDDWGMDLLRILDRVPGWRHYMLKKNVWWIISGEAYNCDVQGSIIL